ncbi:9941_t:CDS:2, partial [Dentiscutata erythropus]
EDEMRTFDKANYAFLMIVDYIDWINSGIPAFFSDGYIEYAWRPDMKDGPTFNSLLSRITECCEKKDDIKP